MGRNLSHGEKEGRYKRSVVGNGKSLGMVVVAVHGHLERGHPFRSSRRDYPDNRDCGTHFVHPSQRCAEDQTSKD